MSLLNWFTRKPASSTLVTPAPQLDSGPATTVTPIPALIPPAQAAASRKIERLAHREFLYSVVRDAMIRAGVLAASYKFKVLSLDARGLQYLIMMDIDKSAMDAIASLSEIESTMAQAAKARHDLQVTAVYWRTLEPSAADIASGSSVPVPPPAGAASSLLEEEIAAFKRTAASGAPAKSMMQDDDTGKARRQHAPVEDFQDTQIIQSDTHGSPLGRTQYGDLN